MVELLVFMSLAIGILAGLFPVVGMASRMTQNTEQDTAAFFHCKSILEELRTRDLEEYIAPKNGFEKQGDGSWMRTVNEVPFHTQGGVKYTKLKATETTTMVPGTRDGIDYYTTTIRVEWKSNRGETQASLTTILYQ